MISGDGTNLLEHEAKILFRQYHISTPRGLFFQGMDGIADSLGNLNFPIIVKAQTTVGGRGKAGAIRTALHGQEALEASERSAPRCMDRRPWRPASGSWECM